MNTTTSTATPTLSPLAQMRHDDMVEFAVQMTGRPASDFTVADKNGVAFPQIVTRKGRSTLVYHVDLVDADGVRYRSRFDEDRAASDWESRNSLTIVTGYHEGIEHESKPIFGVLSHTKARNAALTYARYMDALTRA